MSQWFKFYGQDWLIDPKVISLSYTDRLCFVSLLCLASSSRHEDYRITGLTPETLLSLSHITFDPYNDTSDDWNELLNVLKRLNDNAMITLHDNGDIVINRFKDRQESQLTGYERIKKWREKHKENSEDKPKKDVNVINDNAMITIDKRREDKRRYKYNTSQLDLAKLLLSKIRENIPGFKEPKIEDWAEEIEKMMRIDKRTHKQIEYLIDWTQKSDFWRSNILSTKKLRAKFDQLALQAKRDHDKNKTIIVG